MYRMTITSDEPCKMYRDDLQRYIDVRVGEKYVVKPIKVMNKKDRKILAGSALF